MSDIPPVPSASQLLADPPTNTTNKSAVAEKTGPPTTVDPHSNSVEGTAAGKHSESETSKKTTRALSGRRELSVRLLAEEGNKGKRDGWDKADILAKLLSSVVIAGVGLLINSSIQRTQIASSESNARAQLNAAQLKATDEKKLQEGALTAQLVQHLSSDNPTQREIAIIALRASVPQNIYDATLTVLARSDPSKNVRLRAIENLGNSPNVTAAKALTSIAEDVSRPAEEREVAEQSAHMAASTQFLSGPNEIVFAAASPGERAIDNVGMGHGAFTYALLQGLNGKADMNMDRVVDAGELTKFVVEDVRRLTRGGQTPAVTSSLVDALPLTKPPSQGSEVHAVIVGVSSYGDARIQALSSPERDARSFADFFSNRFGSNTTNVILGAAATREQILSTLERVANNAGPEDAVVFFFSGHGIQVEGRSMIVPYSARHDSPASFIAAEELKAALQRVKHKIYYFDSCFVGNEGR